MMLKLFKNYPARRILSRYKLDFVLLLAVTFIATGLETISIGLIVPLLGSVLQGGGAVARQGWIIDALNRIVNSLPKTGRGDLVDICSYFIVIILAKVLFTIIRDYFKVTITQKIKVDCQKDMFEKNINSSMRFFINNKSGDLTFRVVNLPVEVSTYFTLLPSILIEAINVVFISVLLLSVSVVLFSLIFTLGVVFGAVVWLLSRSVFERAGKECTDAQARQNVIVNESLIGIREIITYGKRQQWSQRFWDQCLRYYQLKKKISILRLTPGSLLELFAIGGLCLIGIYYGLNNAQAARELLPVIAVYAMAIIKVIPSFSRISQDQTQLAVLAPALDLCEKYLGERTSDKSDTGEPVREFRNEIKFEQVTFSYTPQRTVLKDLDLRVPKNKVVAIVGSSGAGKSTIIDLLLGLYDVDAGKILIDGRNFKDMSKSSWRAKIGVVAQNSSIFNATVKENIAMDFKNADMARVKEVARIAGADEFINHLKEGYDTELGDRGFKLSGGQRQRIAIARALYRDPDIVIFDEATSALDYRTEKLINETIMRMLKDKTVIVLAHRLSTIAHADIIYVLKDQRVAQVGSHEQLLGQKGEYSDLYQREIISER